ncbi:MAG: 1-acyl-sn-glycerol-3-phosphate acyltransferase [Polyangiaceae bacterium]|nr:1-acyl-sn-glycerol-3-phosphate acyltransferase [Polyangiaceae bacterium]
MTNQRKRPDILGQGAKKLSKKELRILKAVRATFEPGIVNICLRFFQRTIGQSWIHHSTKNLRHMHGMERLPSLATDESVLVVANHRSFFDLYIVTSELVRRGMKKRIIFPVRSKFFYESWIGFLTNFLMSFLAMYPAIFRERKKASMNLLALDELAFLLNRGGVFAGLHPEGTRKQEGSPYEFLPAQPGVGRVILHSKVQVVPVFINGLINDIKKQIKSNFDGTGEDVHVVFGQPIDFGDLLEQKSNSKTHRAISEKCMEEIARLGEEERILRQEFEAKKKAGQTP